MRKINRWMRGAGLCCLLFIIGAMPESGYGATVHQTFNNNMVLQRGMQIPVFGTGTSGESVSVELSGPDANATKTTTVGSDGKWIVYLPSQSASANAHTLTVNGITFSNVLIGDVWVCAGQSNMEGTLDYEVGFDANTLNNKPIRIFKVKVWYDDEKWTTDPKINPDSPDYGPQETRELFNSWEQVSTSENDTQKFSMAGLLLARELYNATGVPIGLMQNAMGGTCIESWIPQEYFNFTLGNKIKADYYELRAVWSGTMKDGKPQDEPSILYNSLMHPLTRYGVKGFFWWQGEHNTSSWDYDLKNPKNYRVLLPIFAQAMREKFVNKADSNMPFLVMQLHPYGSNGALGVSEIAEVRAGQYYAALNDPDMGISVSHDIRSEGNQDIHPTNREDYVLRAAKVALGKWYNSGSNWQFSGYTSYSISGNTATINFTPGLTLSTTDGNDPREFLIVDNDGNIYDANAKITGSTTVEVSSASANGIAEVRYAFSNLPSTNLKNSNGLPVSGFRIFADDGTPVTIPAAPSGLSAAAASSSSVDLSFTDNADNEDSFNVNYRETGLSTWSAQSFGALSGTGPVVATVSGLTADTGYDFRVCAVNSAGSSAWTATATATTDSENNGTTTLYECEVLSKTSSDTVSTYNDVNASGGKWDYLAANAVGDYVEYTLNVASAGTYDIVFGYKKSSARGVCQLKIDGTNQGSTVNQSGSGWAETALGSKTLTAGSHTFRFQVTAANSGSYALSCDVIKLTGGGTVVDNPPVANAGSDITVTDSDNSGSESVTLDGSASTDDNGISSYTWTEGSTQLGTGATLSKSLSVGTHTITLTVKDAANQTDTDTVVVTVNAGGGTGDLTMTASGSNVVLDWPDYSGNGFTNYRIYRDGSAIDWWEVVSTYTDTTYPGGTVEYLVVAWDNNNKVSLQEWSGTYGDGPVDEAPVADAGSDVTVIDGASVTLDGSGSSDDNGISSYVWTEGSTELGTGATLTQSLSVGVHTIILTVTDTAGQTDSDTVVITVNAIDDGISDNFESGDFSGGTGWVVSSWTLSGPSWQMPAVTTANVPSAGSGKAAELYRDGAIERTISLSGAKMLTYAYKTVGLDAGEFAVCEVLSGGSWSVKKIYTTNTSGSDSVALTGSETAIRFRCSASRTSELMSVDNIEIK